MIYRALYLGLLCCVAQASFAQTADRVVDPLVWLNRMATAAQTLSYSGTFVFQAGTHSESSRIVHMADRGGEIERLEVLDGSPRQIVRDHDELRCYLPNEKRVLIDKRASGTTGGAMRNARNTFPALIDADVHALSNYYTFRRGEIERVAGYAAQAIMLEPRDAWRYGRRLWAEVDSGLIVKAQTLDDQLRPLEQFSFTQLSIGDAARKEAVKPIRPSVTSDWVVENLSASELPVSDAGWSFRIQPPGFVKKFSTQRRLHDGGPWVRHWVFSDGLAAVSVFIAPLQNQGERHPLGASTQGVINFFTRQLAGNEITALGEVPPATVKQIADGVEYRKP